ncbi:MAG: helix-turn-helix transcriptional regulator [Clostridia bacterium]|nr:helix-turn-helix transcriptional regulator [Clostridia bacterium]
MFYDRFIGLCENAGVKPSRVATENGFSKATVSSWKKLHADGIDVEPTAEVLNKLADYFSVSVDYLLGKTDKKMFLINEDEELTEYLYYLKTRPELRMLFKLSAKATKADVERAVKIIEALRKDDETNGSPTT